MSFVLLIGNQMERVMRHLFFLVVILQDFTGVPAVVDLAALRDAMVELGGDPEKVNPKVPVDLVIDHSVQVDVSGANPEALELNLDIEYHRNMERYKFLKMGSKISQEFPCSPTFSWHSSPSQS